MDPLPTNPSPEASPPPPAEAKLSRQQRWEQFLEQRSPWLQKLLSGRPLPSSPAEDEAGSAYRSFEKGCSPHLRQQLQRLAAAPAESWPGGLQPHYCLVEIHDGQYPALRICPTVSSLLQQLNKLVDQDVCVVPFYGLPIEYSTGPQRIIVLPDDTAWEFYPGMQRVARWEAQLDLQDNYYLGPAALAEPTAPLTSLLPGPLPGPTPPPASAAGEDPAGTPA